MTEFMKPEEPANATGLRHIMLESERTTRNWERLANKPCDEEGKVGTLRALIPASVWNYIAQVGRQARTYRELVALVLNQFADPKTGMFQGEKSPAINEIAPPNDGDLDAIGK